MDPIPATTTTIYTSKKAWMGPSNVYIVSGSVAGPLLVFVLYTFCRFSHVRAHPAPLMFAKTLADAGFIYSTLLLSGISSKAHASESSTCTVYGPLIAFFFMSSQFYFIGMCYDLYITCTYPLRSISYTARQVHIYSWTLSAIITTVFVFINPFAYKHEVEGELCFLGINERSRERGIQEWCTFLVPYIVGIMSGLLSLIFVVFRLKNGLGDVFEHAHIMVKDHIIHVALYTILGIVWFILLLETLDSGGLSFAVSFIIIATSAIDCVTWILQKFRARGNAGTGAMFHTRSSSFGDFLRKDTQFMDPDIDLSKYNQNHLQSKQAQSRHREHTMSNALRLELIRSMCLGVTQTLDHFKHNREYNLNSRTEVTALHFSPAVCIKNRMKKGSSLESECIQNQSIHRFLMSYNQSIDFIEYSPHVFRYLRLQCFDTSDIEYAESLKIAIQTNSSIESLSAKFSEGKSGAFFFMTPNSKFIVKTLRTSEAVTFLRILPGYFEHMRKFQHSLLTQFYGLYGIKLYGTRLYFTIMKNIFVSDLEPHEKYDIKGSWINRHTKHHIELGKLMKDEDLKKSILLPHEQSKRIWEQMSHDTRLLDTLNIMDYSLLLGIYYIATRNCSCATYAQYDHDLTYKAPNYSVPVEEEEEEEELKVEQLNEGINSSIKL
eukprot:1069897_1